MLKWVYLLVRLKSFPKLHSSSSLLFATREWRRGTRTRSATEFPLFVAVFPADNKSSWRLLNNCDICSMPASHNSRRFFQVAHNPLLSWKWGHLSNSGGGPWIQIQLQTFLDNEFISENNHLELSLFMCFQSACGSLCTLLMCFFNPSLRVKTPSHSKHSYLSPSCSIIIWFSKYVLVVVLKEQVGQ